MAQLEARGAVIGQMIGYVMTDPLWSSRSGALLDEQVASFVAQVSAGNTSLFNKTWPATSAIATVTASDKTDWQLAPSVNETDVVVKVTGGFYDSANLTKEYFLFA